MFAGYLPPGKNTIYIYDRINKIVLENDVFVDITQTLFGREGHDWLINVK